MKRDGTMKRLLHRVLGLGQLESRVSMLEQALDSHLQLIPTTVGIPPELVNSSAHVTQTSSENSATNLVSVLAYERARTGTPMTRDEQVEQVRLWTQFEEQDDA